MLAAKMFLETDRLIIRTYEEQDASALHQFVRDNTYYLYETGPMTLKNNTSVSKSQAFLQMLEAERQNGKWVWNGIFDKKTMDLLGQVSIYNFEESNKSCELGYFITADQMSKGYATEAVKAIINYCFFKLLRSMILLRIKPDNIASKRVAQKLGFQKIGLQKKSFKTYHGNFIDQEVFNLYAQPLR